MLILDSLSRSLKALQSAGMSKVPPPHTHATRGAARAAADTPASNPPTSGSLADNLSRSKLKATSVPGNKKGKKGKKDLGGGKALWEPEELQDAVEVEAGALEEELEVSVHGVGKSLKATSASAPPRPTLPSHSDDLSAPKIGSSISVTLVAESQSEGPNGAIPSKTPPMTFQVKLPVVGFEYDDPLAPVFSRRTALAKLHLCDPTALRFQASGFQLMHVVSATRMLTTESDPEIVKFLGETFGAIDPTRPPSENRPSILMIDQACKTIAHLINSGKWFMDQWDLTTQLIVDLWHYLNHLVTDELCVEYCNPAPLNGSQPNLVVADPDNPGRLLRAFNTEAAEQLNAWIVGFAPMVGRMQAEWFNFFSACYALASRSQERSIIGV
ncbi:hypothetical protein P7C70_g5917, partial [Phenoliferia sp. Uapishka_3]